MVKSKKIPTDNTSGYRGVYFIRGRYQAKIVFQKKQYYLGAFEQIEDAARARQEAEDVLFGQTAAFYEKWKERAEQDPEWAKNNPVRVHVDRGTEGQLKVSFQPHI